MPGIRISKQPAVFNAYINNGDDYLALGTPTNGSRLGLSAGQIADWHTKREYWHDTLYPKYSSDTDRTMAIVEETHNFIRDFRLFANPLLDIMAASEAATEADEAKFNFVKRVNRKQPTRKTVAIAEECLATLKVLGGGMVQNFCRTDHDTQRPSLAEDSNAVEVSYTLVDMTASGGGNPQPNPNPGGSNDMPPAASQGMVSKIFTTAKFVLECGNENSGMTLVIYHRWINTHYPKLAGPWSTVQIKRLV